MAPSVASETYASLDAMGLGFADGEAKRTAAVDLDGPITESVTAATTAMARTPPSAAEPAATQAARPVAPRETRAASLDVRDPEHPDLFADPDGDAPAAGPMKVPPLHPRIYDASEDTPLDPLRNKSYDLNTAKTIPADLFH